MDEVSTDTAGRQRWPRWHLRSTSGDMVRQKGTGLGKASVNLVNVIRHSRFAREEPLYKVTKREEVGSGCG